MNLVTPHRLVWPFWLCAAPRWWLDLWRARLIGPVMFPLLLLVMLLVHLGLATLARNIRLLRGLPQASKVADG